MEVLNKGGWAVRFFFADFRKGSIIKFYSSLSNLSIRNVMLRWIAAFLCERSQFVRVGTHSSTFQYINGGIPQGTKLGPLLFTVMVSEILSTWVLLDNVVDDLNALEIVPRNSPSVMSHCC